MTRTQRYSLGILLALQLVLGIVAATAQPLWLGHEPDYFNVVRFLAENGRLPGRSDFDSAPRDADIAQATQPPLFSYAALPLVALLDDGEPVPPGVHPGLICEGAAPTGYPYVLTTAYNPPPGGTPAAGYSLRLLNLAFALGMTVTVYFAARQVTASSHGLALLAAALVAFMPQIFALGVFISGESLLLLISGTNLYFALRLARGETVRLVDLTGVIVTAILGPLTKTNGYVLLIGTAALLAILILRPMITEPRSRTTRLLLAGAGVLVLSIILLSVFNYVQYGSIIGRYQNVFSIAVYRLKDLNLTNLTATLRDTNYDYTSVFPIQRQKVLWLYTLGGVFGLIPFLAHMLGAAIRRNTRQLTVDGLLLVYALVAFILVLMRANLVGDLTPDKTHTPIRYYVSGLPAIAVMLAIGWHSLVPRTWQQAISKRSVIVARLQPWQWIGWAWALVWIGVVAWNVTHYVQEHPARSVYSAEEFQTLAAERGLARVPDDPSLPADVPRLRAYDASAGEDGILRLTGYWQVAETPTLNAAARVLVADGSGASTACELIPHDGVYPVTRWEPDQIVAVEMEIPNCADGNAALSGPLDVTIDWIPADAAGRFVTQDAPPGQALAVDADLPHARTCLRNLGVIGDVFQVIQYTGPTTATAGTPFLPSVNWYVRDAVPQGNFARDYVMGHAETGEVYTCRGAPRLGDHPIERWRRGETVYFDQCAIGISAEATPGEYNVYIGLTDLETGERLLVTPVEAGASGDRLLHVAKVMVQPAAQPVAEAD